MSTFQTFAVRTVRAVHSNHTIRNVDIVVEEKIMAFDVGDEVLKCREKAFGNEMTRNFETKWCGHGIYTEARHPWYLLQESGKKDTRKIHAQRPNLFHRRPEDVLN